MASRKAIGFDLNQFVMKPEAPKDPAVEEVGSLGSGWILGAYGCKLSEAYLENFLP